MFKSVAIIGSSRGLGKAIALFVKEHLAEAENLYLFSRKTNLLSELEKKLNNQFKQIKTFSADMSKAEDVSSVSQELARLNPDLVIYSAGGGPHGEFIKKEWKDHEWALRVGLVSPVELLHKWLNIRNPDQPGRFIIVGSRIAESDPDFKASSYAAAKHGLLGLISSIQPELQNNQNKAWLFSPGYIDTEMLPQTATVRHNGAKIMSVETAAQALLRWVKKDGPWHRVLN